MVDLDTARRVVETGILKPGDVIAYAGTNRAYVPHGHSVVYIGNKAVANHTRLNHPAFKGYEGGSGNWERYATPSRKHPLVSVIHFNDDQVSPRERLLQGWWKIIFSSGQEFYYFFEDFPAHCKVWWTRQAPLNSKKAPPGDRNRQGYWFDRGGSGFVNCWSSTGSVERYIMVSDHRRIMGILNNRDAFVGTKL
jgi:hypothetical protein